MYFKYYIPIDNNTSHYIALYPHVRLYCVLGWTVIFGGSLKSEITSQAIHALNFVRVYKQVILNATYICVCVQLKRILMHWTILPLKFWFEYPTLFTLLKQADVEIIPQY